MTLLVGWQEGHLAVKTEWWGAGVVICLQRGANLHMAQLMLLPLTVSCFSKIQIGFTILVPEKGPLNECVCVCVCQCTFTFVSCVWLTVYVTGCVWSQRCFVHLKCFSVYLSAVISIYILYTGSLITSHWLTYLFINFIYLFICLLLINSCLPCLYCFDAVGWAAGRASGL